MKANFVLPEILEAEKTPLVLLLLEIIEQLYAENLELKTRVMVLEEEIKTLKGLNQRPKISPSKMDKDTSQFDDDDPDKKKKTNKNHKNRSKNDHLKIDAECIVKLENVPKQAIFKGYTDFIVQDLDIKAVTTKYRLGRWEMPDGTVQVAKLPEDLQGKHFGPGLRAFLVSQYYFQHVTQPELLKLVRSWGIDISSGQLSDILTKDKESFHQEKDEILKAGLASSNQANVDDTSARHQGKNGYCTHIGNDLFAWFESTNSRINFLQLLRQEHTDFILDENAIDYCKKQNLAAYVIDNLKQNFEHFKDQASFEIALKQRGITQESHIKIVTEAALIGSILSHGFDINFRIISDDAGQFNIFKHALCWIHAERKIKALIPLNAQQSQEIDQVLNGFWRLYDTLKLYKQNPTETDAELIREKFDQLCIHKTESLALQKVLKKLAANKAELLLVLQYPDLPLHNNLSERDIREYVRMRKTNGSTRSDEGRRCRDTFASLKKTCLKLQVNTWDFLVDRHKKTPQIARLPELIKLRATTTF